MARMKLRKPKDDDSDMETPRSVAKASRSDLTIVPAAAAAAPKAAAVTSSGAGGSMEAVLQGLMAIGGLASAGGSDSPNILGALLQALQHPQQHQQRQGDAHIQILPRTAKAAGLPPVAEAGEDADEDGVDEADSDADDGAGALTKKPARADPVAEMLEQIASKGGARVCVSATGGKGRGGGRGKAGGRGGAPPKAKATVKAGASAKPKGKPKAKPKAKCGSLKKRPAGVLGCSKCRYLVNGCAACR